MYSLLISNKPFMLYGIYPSISFFGICAYLTSSPYIFQNWLGMSPIGYGNLALLIGSSIVLGSIINVKCLNRYTPAQLIYVNAFVMFISGLLILAGHILSIQHWAYYACACVIYFLAIPFGFPNANTLSLSYIKSHYGTASSLMTFVQLMTGFIASTIFALLHEEHFLPLGLLYIGLSFVAMVWVSCLNYYYHPQEK